MNRRVRVAAFLTLLALSSSACGHALPAGGASGVASAPGSASLTTGSRTVSASAAAPFVITVAAGHEAEANALADAFVAAHPGATSPGVEVEGAPGANAGNPVRFTLSAETSPSAGDTALRFSTRLPAPNPGSGETRLAPGSPFVLAPEGTNAAPSRPALLLARPGGVSLTGPPRLFWEWAADHGQEAIDAAPSATLAVVGDLQLARGLETMMARHGLSYPLERVAKRLSAAGLTIANLESPLGRTGKPLPGKGIWFRARPEAAAVVTQGGFDAVTVANNHILDYDTENFLETLDLLRAIGVRAVGGGAELAAARRPVLLEARGIRVALLGYSQFADILFSYAHPRPFAATESRPGVAPLQTDLVATDIASARKQADVVAVLVHWGDEYQNLPNRQQVEWAHAFVDAGADLVLGFHPHAIQGFEAYGRGLIAYSLGNFVMDQWEPVTTESMLLEIALTRGRDGQVRVGPARVTPVGIRDFRPYFLTGPARERLWEKMRGISTPLGNKEAR